ncbi:unnamed protein product [Durusdinium trenchii]
MDLRQELLQQQTICEGLSQELAEQQGLSRMGAGLEEDTTANYMVELAAAQDEIRKLEKSMMDISVQRSELAAQEHEAQTREKQLATRAAQLEAKLGSKTDETTLEQMCERIRVECFQEMESCELATAVAQQRAASHSLKRFAHFDLKDKSLKDRQSTH